jgi:N-methylhydantoinase A
MPVDVLAALLTAIGVTPKPTAAAGGNAAGTLSDALVEERRMWSLEAESFVDVSVYDGTRLPVGPALPGPAIVELGTSTLVVHETYDLQVDSGGSYIVTARDAAPRPSVDGLLSGPAR